MPNPLRAPRLTTALLALVLASAGRAQANPPAATPAAEPAPAPTVETSPVSQAPQADATPTRPKHERVMSDEVAASLATGMPKYDPPPKLPEPKPEDEQVDLRDVDKPRNKIIRLPKYVVKEPKPPVFRERDLHTQAELSDLALKKYAGLKFGNVAGLNAPTALLMYQEKERLEDRADLKDEAKSAKNSGDSTTSDYIMRESNQIYYRPTDFSWNSDGGGK